jgi:hypothetical protein
MAVTLQSRACNCSQHWTVRFRMIIFVVFFLLLVISTEEVPSPLQPPHAQVPSAAINETGHTKNALKLGPSEFQARIESWASQQHNRSRPTLVLRPKYGLGNQLLSLVSGIALALVADRRLLVAWEGPFRFLLDPPFHLPEEMDGSSGGRATVHFTAHSPRFPAAARALACGDLKGLLPAHVVEVEADQFFLPLVLLSPQVGQACGEKGWGGLVAVSAGLQRPAVATPPPPLLPPTPSRDIVPV